MRWQLLLFSMLPLVIYVVVAARAGHCRAVAAAVATALLEFVHNSLLVGFVEPFSGTSLALCILFGALSLRPASERLFRFQPVALGVVSALAFWIYDSRSDVSLLPLILEQYVNVNEALPSYQHGYVRVYAGTLSRSLPYLLVLHSVCTAWAAMTLSNVGWLLVRVMGFYVSVGALFLAERVLRLS